MTAKKVINYEKQWVREKAYPRPNKFSYGRSEPWCADFQHYCLDACGYKAFTKKFSNFAYCPAIWADAGRMGYRKYSGKPGDLVLFDWNGDKVSDHIGMVVRKGNGGYYTVEGNTSSLSASNGNCVQVRFRETRFIRGFVRPPYKKAKPFKKPAPLSYKGKMPTLIKHNDGTYLAISSKKSKNAKLLQKFLNWYMDAGLATDGIYGKMTKQAVYTFQKHENLVKDGVFGKKSLKAAQVYKAAETLR